MDQGSRQPDLFVYPYDWRRDNGANATNLQAYLKLIRMFHPEMEKVDIIAHSMGGLVARRFILDHPGVVQKCITIATPWLGAPKAIAALETGDFDSLAMNLIVRPVTLQTLAEDFPGMHQLLPSKAYFDLGGAPMSESNWDLDGDGTSGESYTYTDYKAAIDQVFGTRSGARPVANNEAFHSRTTPLGGPDDWTTDSTGVDHCIVYGVQKVPRTIGRIRTAMRLRPVNIECSDLILDMPWKPTTEKDLVYYNAGEIFEGHDRYALERRFEFSRVEGDGTVPTLSATRRNGSMDLAPDARLFPMVSTAADQDGSVEHNGLLSNTNVLHLVRDLLNEAIESTVPPAGVAVPLVVVTLTGHDAESAGLTDSSGDTDAGRNVPDGGTGIGLAGELKNLIARFISWKVDDRSGRASIEYHIYNTESGNTNHTLAFQPLAGQRYSVRALRYSNGVPSVVHRWLNLDPALGATEVRISWTDTSTNGVRVFAGSGPTNVPPTVTGTGSTASDDTPPSMTTQLAEVDDDRMDVDDDVFLRLDPTDNTSADEAIRFYMAYDRLEDGDPFNDLYRPLSESAFAFKTNVVTGPGGVTTTTVVRQLALPDVQMQPLNLVVDDATGNPGFIAVPKAPPMVNDDTYCSRLGQEKAVMQTAIDLAVAAVNASPWVLPAPPGSPPGTKTAIQYILEQGSGSCLWVDPICERCKGIFTPDSSDHDYEIFLPVFSLYTAAPSNFADHPYDTANIQGDWYFRPPVPQASPTGGSNLVWSLPGVVTITRPYSSALANKTPANYISEILTAAAVVHLESEGYTFAAKNLTMFTARDEHFRNGLIDLELPLESGSDPLGDAGTGRQMLMLKWILEGAYVPGYVGPSLDLVYQQFHARGIKTLEAFEWGNFHEFAALGSAPLLRTTEITGMAQPEAPAHDFLYDVRKRQVKAIGKAAIRATIAAMVGAGLTNSYMLSPAQFAGLKYRGYEEMIAKQAAQVPNPGIFGPATVADIQKFYLAKVANKDFMKNILKPDHAAEANQFIATGIRFLRFVQASNGAAYTNDMAALAMASADEYAARQRNLSKILAGFPNAGKPGLLHLRTNQTIDLTLRAINDGPLNADNARITVNMGGTQGSVSFGLPADVTEEFEGSSKKAQQFYLAEQVTGGSPSAKTFTAVLSNSGGSTWKEPYNTNNWFGFHYYVLDVANPTIPSLPDISPPAGIPPEDVTCRIQTSFR